MAEFKIEKEVGKASRRIKNLDFRIGDFGLPWQLVERMPWEVALKDREALYIHSS